MNEREKKILMGENISPLTADEIALKTAVENGNDALSELSDVELTEPSNGQVIAYDAESEKWKNVDQSGGGSGGGVFITTANYDETTLTSTLDKTWQEIHDAISSGMIGVVRSATTASETPTAYADTLISVIFYNNQGGNYKVVTYEDGSQVAYTTATANGYPSFSDDDLG